MNKKLLSILLALSMIFTMLPVKVMAAESARTGDVYVCGTKVGNVPSEYNVSMGTTYWTISTESGNTELTEITNSDEYNNFNIKCESGDTPKLTLKGANITYGSPTGPKYGTVDDASNNAIWIANNNLDLILIGDNTIENKIEKSSAAAINTISGGDLNILGDGSLTAKGYYGIYATGSISISGGTVTASALKNDNVGVAMGNSLSYSADKHSVTASVYSDGSSPVTFNVGDIIWGITTYKYLKFEPKSVTNNYNIWVGGTQVTSANADDVLGDDTVSYNNATKTLTLNNADISKAKTDSFWSDTFSIHMEESRPLKLNLIGENTIDGVDSEGSTYGIYCNNALTIEGEGSLTVRPGRAYITDGDGNNDSSGIFAYRGLTINNTTLNMKGEQYGLYSYEGITINGGNVTAYGSKYAINGNLKTNGEKDYVKAGNKETEVEWDGSTALNKNYKYVEIDLEPNFITDIEMTDTTSVEVNTNLTLEATVVHDNVKDPSISWSVEDAKGTGATITEKTFIATSAGTARVKASVKNGLTASDAFTKTFDIIVTQVPTVSHIITASAGTGGSISPSGSVIVNNGEDQTFTITANSNYSIADVKVDDVSQGKISSYSFDNVTANHTISASFSYNGGSNSGGGSSSSGGSSSNNKPPVVAPVPTPIPTPIPTPTPNKPSFTDVVDHWAKEDIEFVAEKGLFSGTSSSSFSPDTDMTRGMFVTVLGRLANVDVNAYKNSSFIDVDEDDYYMGYIQWASENNISNGIGNNKYAPNQAISREQMAVFISNYAKTIGFILPGIHEENTFTDSSKINDYAKDAVKQLQMAGLIDGKDGNIFDPQGTATRAEIATVLRRFVELVNASSSI